MKAKDVKTREDFITYFDQIGAVYVVTTVGTPCGYCVIRVYDKRCFDIFDEHWFKAFNGHMDIDKPHIEIYPSYYDDDWHVKRYNGICSDFERMRVEWEPVVSFEKLCKEVWAMSRRKRVT